MSYRKLTAEEKEQVVSMYLSTRSAVVTGETWGIEPAEVIAIHFFHGQPLPEPPSPSPKVMRLVPARRMA